MRKSALCNKPNRNILQMYVVHSAVTAGGQRGESPTWQANFENWPLELTF